MKRNKFCSLIALTVSIISLTGCQGDTSHVLEEIPRDVYQKLSYDTVTAQRGNLQPTLVVPLNLESMEYNSYTVEASDIELKEIKVSLGDYVTEGQELIVFESEELEKKVEAQRQDLTQKKLLLDHVKKMRMIDVDESKLDDENMKATAEAYDLQISMLQDDINVSSIYLNEKEEELKKCKIIAKKSGTVTYLSTNLLNGIVVPGSDMITITCGEIEFSSEVKDDYDFRVGDIFSAESVSAQYEVMVTNIVDNDGRSRSIYFKPVSSDIVYVGRDKFSITIQKELLKDVVYVNKQSIQTDAHDNSFVYVADGDGFQKAVYVETGTVEGDMIIITKGLNGGEEVVLR